MHLRLLKCHQWKNFWLPHCFRISNNPVLFFFFKGKNQDIGAFGFLTSCRKIKANYQWPSLDGRRTQCARALFKITPCEKLPHLHFRCVTLPQRTTQGSPSVFSHCGGTSMRVLSLVAWISWISLSDTTIIGKFARVHTIFQRDWNYGDRWHRGKGEGWIQKTQKHEYSLRKLDIRDSGLPTGSTSLPGSQALGVYEGSTGDTCLRVLSRSHVSYYKELWKQILTCYYFVNEQYTFSQPSLQCTLQ